MKRKTPYIIAILVLTAIGIIVWLMANIFEKEKPVVKINALPKFISSSKKIFIQASDKKMGLREIRVELIQGKKRALLFKKDFRVRGLLNKKGTHQFRKVILMDPIRLGFSDGILALEIYARDCSRRNMGKGNLTILKKEVVVDTIPPSIVPRSRLNYFSVGGSGLITYEVSKDTVTSGVYLNHLFFPGYLLDTGSKRELNCVCYIAIPCHIKSPVNFYIWAKDRAGNESVARFYYRIKPKIFRKSRIVITDGFLKRVLPFFSFYKFIKL